MKSKDLIAKNNVQESIIISNYCVVWNAFNLPYLEKNLPMNLVCDLGGTRCKLALVGDDDRIACTRSHALPEHVSIHDTMRAILEIAKEMSQSLNLPPESLRNIGLALPGIVDAPSCKVLSINDKHRGVLDFDFKEWAFSNGFQRIVIENDARAALLGESRFNSELEGVTDCVGLTLGTGIGVAALLDGRLLRGPSHQAVINMGHSIIRVGEGECNCGGIGCAEVHASTWALRDATPWTSFSDLFERVDHGDSAAIEALHAKIDAWAACILNCIYAYDPQVVILGGGVMNRHEMVLPRLRDRIRAFSWNGFQLPSLIRSVLLEQAAPLGMHAMLQTKP